MDNNKTDNYYISKVIENIDTIMKYTSGKNYDDFTEDTVLVDATLFRLIQMVENLNHISKEFRINHPQISWGLIIGFRNGIVHEYGRTDYSIVYEIISSDIYTLKKELLK